MLDLIFPMLVSVAAASAAFYLLRPWRRRRALLNRQIKSLRLYARREKER